MTRDENNGQKPRGGPGQRRDTSSRAPKRPPAKVATAPNDEDGKTGRQRIAKLMARVGLCSRRDAETWIEDGRVEVNGVTLTSPALDVSPQDKILVDGIPLPSAEKTRLFMFHKPGGLITSDHDPEGRQTVADYLREHWPDGPRVVTVGRLDYNTEGLLLLTNDGGLARVLELPATGWVRRYRVRAKGETTQPELDKLMHGVTIEGIEYAGIEAKLDRIQGANCWLTMGLREGKNREVKRVLEHIGLDVNRLIRLSFGPFQLLDLPEGHVEEVKTRILRDQLGPTLAAEAGVDFSEPEMAPIVAAPKAIIRSPARGRRDDRAAKPMRESKGRTAAPHGRDFRDRDLVERRDLVGGNVAPEKRERPVAGPRRHVSTLRTDKAIAIERGPRQRLERTDTLDRHNRAVKVERIVPSAPVAAKGQRARPERRERPEPSERSPMRRERSVTSTPERRERASASTAFPKTGRGSQSAQGKRERIARSGGGPREEQPARARPERSFTGDRPARSDARGARDAAPARDGRQPRREAEASRSRVPGAKPFRGKPSSSGRPATGRSAEARHSKDRPQRGRSAEEKPTGGRLRIETKAFQARDKSARGAGAKMSGERPARGKSDGGKTRVRPNGGDKPGAPKGASRGRQGPSEGTGGSRRGTRPGGSSRPPRAPRG